MSTTVLSLSTLSLTALAALLAFPLVQPMESAFARATVDIGIVVSDIDAAARFYGETLGLDESDGFAVPADFCRDVGLTDTKPLAVRVFALADGEAATKLKLMEVAGAEPARSDNSFIHSQLGLSYLTIFVRDLDAVMTQLATAGVEPLAKGPLPLAEGERAPHLILVRDPDGNLIELIGPHQ